MKINSLRAITGVAVLSLSMSVWAATVPLAKNGLLENFDKDGIVDLGGNPYSDMLALSSSGKIAVGFIATPANNNQAGAWTVSHGLIALPIPFAQTEGMSNAQGVSSDGRYIVGYVMPENSSLMQGVLWTEASKLTYLRPLAAGTDYYANGISADGSIIVGTASDKNNNEHAVYWDRVANTIHDLGSFSHSSSQYSNAIAANRDGSVIVGSSTNFAGVTQGFRWTTQTGMVELQSLGETSQATGVSDTGRIIGYSTNAKNEGRAVYWDKNKIRDLGTLRADNSGSSSAQAISATGKVIVGSADSDTQRTGFIWKEGAGMYSVNEWLKYAHVQANSMSVKSVNAISADSQTIAGQLTNGHGYVAHLIELKDPADVNPSSPKPDPELPTPEQPKPEQPKPEQPKPEQPKPEQPKPEPEYPSDHHVVKPGYHASGIVETRQVVSSLYFVQRNLEVQRQLLDVAASQADCASFGADGMCVKAQADLRFRGGEVQYRVPAASLTVAYQFYPQWRLGLSAMAADMHIKDANGGRITQQAPAFTLFTGYGNAGEAGWKAYAGVTLLDAGMDIERAYHNGDAREIGYGHTRTRAYDFNLSGGYTFTPYAHVQLTPYLALGYHSLRWNGYDEADNSVFAAHFDGLRSKVTSAALGVATQWQVSARSSLGLDISVEKNIKQHNSRAVASVLGGFAGLASQYQVPDVDDVMPHVEASYTFAADKHQAVSLSAGYQDIGVGSGEGNVGLTYRIAF
ncbi:Autotransporter protein or domain, integral membrane beta-barrel involved in protein secretion [Plesiomonas shigelloides]|uniref:autotransporter domain-containing protein n=2 Tax=Plesiomonas shigelloides TaxID=703 RepID=UPI000D92AD4A|nr:autotransporter domain-containing protein [Plesiomonas shigelloides]SPZ45210.1 Autotransporter protein or domain, integral membrane beta-barrel involved in protein secretion [Plesiomonas shigelloides]